MGFFAAQFIQEDLLQEYYDGWRAAALERRTNSRGRVVLFDSSESYSLVGFAPCRVRVVLPDVKVVYLLRDATELAAAQYVRATDGASGLQREVSK